MVIAMLRLVHVLLYKQEAFIVFFPPEGSMSTVQAFDLITQERAKQYLATQDPCYLQNHIAATSL